MATLGNSNSGANNVGGGVGRMVASRFTLASAATLNELRGWFAFGTAGDTVRVVIYKHVSGTTPDNATLVAYTNPLTLTGSGTAYTLAQTGFSVALAAADYWIGARFNTSGNTKGDTGSGRGITTGVADPPPATFGVTDFSITSTVSCWAVVTAVAAPTFVPQIIAVI
jgi:hypothetical protein